MKLEEVLPAYREGKTIISKEGDYYNSNPVPKRCTYILGFAANEELLGEWEIEKEKVKTYPALIKETNRFWLTQGTHKTIESARLSFLNNNNWEVIRLITEIPELTEEEEV